MMVNWWAQKYWLGTAAMTVEAWRERVMGRTLAMQRVFWTETRWEPSSEKERDCCWAVHRQITVKDVVPESKDKDRNKI